MVKKVIHSEFQETSSYLLYEFVQTFLITSLLKLQQQEEHETETCFHLRI